MPIHLYWEDESQTILRWDFDGEWSMDDMFDATARSQEMRIGLPPPVVLIDHRRAATFVPTGALYKLADLAHVGKDTRRLLVVVTPFEFYLQVGRIISEVYREMARSMQVVRTMPEADRILQPYREAIAHPSMLESHRQ
ncbi:MAG: hypothetical protein U0670_12975 [Anaerolineae bacterium]